MMCIKYAFLIKQLRFMSILRLKYLHVIDSYCIFVVQEKG